MLFMELETPGQLCTRFRPWPVFCKPKGGEEEGVERTGGKVSGASGASEGSEGKVERVQGKG